MENTQVFGYVRVSTSGQVREGYSLEQQKEEINKFCSENDFELMKMYEDAGISGAKFDEDDMSIDRPGLQDMLADLSEGISYIVVLTTSRLWRSDIVKAIIQRDLRKVKADIKAIDRPNYSIYDKDPTAYLINGMMELLDQYERLEIAKRLRRGRRAKASKGGYAGGNAPMGYKRERHSRKLTIDPSKIEIVKHVFKVRKEHPKFTLDEIAESLFKAGLKTSTGRKFHRRQVKRMLDNRDFYAGKYAYDGVSGVDGQHEIIDGILGLV
ncbi:recombinase family protein [Candidatus Poribacteria bacterium]|nr:recombinase family protein [Candidatus Poribacteria bacterium]